MRLQTPSRINPRWGLREVFYSSLHPGRVRGVALFGCCRAKSALPIQPDNPATLHYLGVLRLQQGQYQQAETLATRSNMRVGRNIELGNRNFQLIQAAQQAQASNTPPKAKLASK